MDTTLSDKTWEAMEERADEPLVAITIEEGVLPVRATGALPQAASMAADRITGVWDRYFMQEFKRHGRALKSILVSQGYVIIAGNVVKGDQEAEITLTFRFAPGIIMWFQEIVKDFPYKARILETGTHRVIDEKEGSLALSRSKAFELEDLLDVLKLGRIIPAGGSPSDPSMVTGRNIRGQLGAGGM